MPGRLRVLLLSAALLVAGCGGDGDGDAATATDTATDRRLAQAALLVLSDLPAGFVESEDEEEEAEGAGEAGEEDAFDQCVSDKDAELEAGTTAEEEGPDFDQPEQFLFAGSTSVVLRTESLARDGIEVLGSDRMRSCFNDAMAEEIRDDAAEDGPEFTASTEELAYFEVGDEVEAFRTTMTADAAGETLELLMDVVFVRKGRTIGIYFFGGVGDGYPVEEQTTVVNRALARVG